DGFRSDSGQRHGDDVIKSNRRKRRHKKKKKVVVVQDLDLDLDLNSSVREAPELRQRSGYSSFGEEAVYRSEENGNVKVKEVDDSSSRAGSVSGKELDMEMMMKQNAEINVNVNVNGHHVGRMLEKDKSMDWKQVMAEKDPNYNYLLESSPIKYFVEEMHGGNSLRTTTTLANEKDRERVIDVGFFVCLDSFLSLLTIMPIRLVATCWRLLKTRQYKMLSAAELSDFGCFLMLAFGVILLQQTDISLIYHMIRGQGTIKLYVVYNVLEIFDKLCQNFGGDVLQTLFNTADGLANCSPESEHIRYWQWRFICDEVLAVASSNILFHEIENSVERFHIASFLIFVLAQNILEAEGPWFENFLYNAFVVYICELMIDIIKHSFIAKFNEIKPVVYSEFLEDLCKQTLNIEPETPKKNLTFVPLAPASVVIRVLSPVYAAHLPCGPVLWRLLWILILAVMSFVMLTTLKVMIGMGLRKHATWYIKRCQRRKLHSD
ncbi:hypothetical protein M8C21_018957, partial [Ambrosia artemisiifolia]